jgi:hypothetical protein
MSAHRHWCAVVSRSIAPADADLRDSPQAGLQAAQSRLQGHIVLPSYPDCDHDRQIFNLVFNACPVDIYRRSTYPRIRAAIRGAAQGGVRFRTRAPQANPDAPVATATQRPVARVGFRADALLVRREPPDARGESCEASALADVAAARVYLSA